MKIFLIWLGIICCGVANGFIYQNFFLPERFILMAAVSMIAVIILIIHRRITCGWLPYLDMWTGFRVPIFKITMIVAFLCAFVLIVMIPCDHKGVMAAIITIGISSFLARIREMDYISDDF